MRRGAVLLAAAMAIAACDVSPGAGASPAAAATAPDRPNASPLAATAAPASPSPQPTSRPGIRANAAGTLPESFRYVALDLALADGFRTRLWLVDLAARRAPVMVAEWDAPASPVGGYSASSDGQTVMVSAAGTRSRVALYLLRPVTGETRVLFEEQRTIVISPRVSPDGQRYAFTQYPADGGSDLGMWSSLVSGGPLRRIVEPTTRSNVPAMALAWSAGSEWLAFSRELGRTEILLAPRDGGAEVDVGAGDKVSWRATAPELLVAASDAPASRVYTFDVAARKTRDLFTVPKLFVPFVQWHPRSDRFVYVEAESASRESSGGIWTRNADGSAPVRLDAGVKALSPEWSADGTLLTVLAGGEDATIPIIDLVSGRRVSMLCRRAGTPPGNCL